MLFNYTRNFQFTSRLMIDNVNFEVVNEEKLLGTNITDDLKGPRDLEKYKSSE